MKRRVTSRIFVLFAVLMLVMTPCLSFTADSTMLSNPTVLNANLQKGSGGGVPVGTVIAWPAASNPEDAENWLECNGQAISQTAYPELAALMGATVPDFRGLFLRGHGSQSHVQANGTTVGMTSTLHESGALGMVQGDAQRRITSYFIMRGNRADPTPSGAYPSSSRGWATYAQGIGNGPAATGIDTALVVPTSTENRPINVAVRYLIRAVR